MRETAEVCISRYEDRGGLPHRCVRGAGHDGPHACECEPPHRWVVAGCRCPHPDLCDVAGCPLDDSALAAPAARAPEGE